MEKGFGLCGDQEADGHSSWAPWSYMQMEETYRRTNIIATLHQSGLYGGVAKLNLLLSEERTLGMCKKAPKGPSDSEKQDSLVWSTSILSIVFERNQALLITCRVPSQK